MIENDFAQDIFNTIFKIYIFRQSIQCVVGYPWPEMGNLFRVRVTSVCHEK